MPTSYEVGEYIDKFLASDLPKKGTVWLDFTSGNPDLSYKLSEKLEKYEVGFVDAPMSGGVRGARHSTLSIMYSGEQVHVDKVIGIIEAVGKKLLYIDKKAGSGHAVKAINNLIYGCNLAITIKGI